MLAVDESGVSARKPTIIYFAMSALGSSSYRKPKGNLMTRTNRYGTWLLVVLLVPSLTGQVHRPSINPADSQQDPLDNLPYITLSESIDLRSHIDQRTPEGERASRFDYPTMPPLYDPKTADHNEHRRVIGNPAFGSLPTPIADLIAIGVISSESVHITKSGTNLYSTFNFLPETYLKKTPGVLPASLVLERSGGVALYPSGRKVLISPLGMGIPEAGYRYLLFLKYMASPNSYHIITGYLLSDHTITPLDARGDALKDIDSGTLISRVTQKLQSH
jgi:hypothetical protein